MKPMVETLGQPEDEILRDGTYMLLFFSQKQDSTNPVWWHKAVTGFQPQNRRGSSRSSSLDDLVMLYPKAEKIKERTAFVHLLRKMMCLKKSSESPLHKHEPTDKVSSALQRDESDAAAAGEATASTASHGAASLLVTDPYEAESADKGPVTASSMNEASETDIDEAGPADESDSWTSIASATCLRNSQKKPLKRMRRFSGRMFRAMCCCCSVAVDE
ncbi:homeodomain-interacting protein kinase 4-like isoform X2 [Scomber scombrus]|uniref:Homeodomain-interacting protein kinase 4-like isoform X2 n=1 Tax=Scomber scombrus TaxID=13677 RepID=A0AAV1NUR0_SCOSC